MATVQSIVDNVQITLVDAGATHWTEAELEAAVNQAITTICNERTDLNVTIGTLTLVAGTKQTLPDGAIALVDVMRNTNGRAVRRASMSMMDAQRPDWHSDTAAATRNYFYDPRTPRTFYVWPPASAYAQVEAKYSTPPTYAALGQNIPIGDEWVPAIREYVLYIAFSKDAEVSANVQRAALHEAAFRKLMSGKAPADAAKMPMEE